jgi:DNA-binding CsgD family transcriptional regulator
MMSSVSLGDGNATVIRLDYEQLGSGPVLIVIDGLPGTETASVVRVVGTRHVAWAGRATVDGLAGPPASALIEEAEAITGATGYQPVLSTSLVLAAWRGQEARALELMNATIEDATPESEGSSIALAEYARAILYNGLGRYAVALAAAERACADETLGPFAWALNELVEAGARSGKREVAAAALRRHVDRAPTAITECELGIRALSAALLSDRDHSEARFGEALDRFRDARSTLHLARAQLLYGEWLRRAGRRVDAREQLHAALGTFARVRAEGFAERAHRELLATGETARRRTVETRDELTPQEAQIAHLAADGQTNPEIGAQLFISPRTVEWHLRKVFRKLRVSSRRELGLALRSVPRPMRAA